MPPSKREAILRARQEALEADRSAWRPCPSFVVQNGRRMPCTHDKGAGHEGVHRTRFYREWRDGPPAQSISAAILADVSAACLPEVPEWPEKSPAHLERALVWSIGGAWVP